MSDARGSDGPARRKGLGFWFRTLGQLLFLGLCLLGYLCLQVLLSIWGSGWTPLTGNGGDLLLRLGLLLLSLAVLFGVRHQPGVLRGKVIEHALLASGVAVWLVTRGLARAQPYTATTVYLSLYHSTGGNQVNPGLFSLLSLLVFLAALGHAARLGALWKRWLLLDAPMIATFALLLRLSQHVPEATG